MSKPRRSARFLQGSALITLGFRCWTAPIGAVSAFRARGREALRFHNDMEAWEMGRVGEGTAAVSDGKDARFGKCCGVVNAAARPGSGQEPSCSHMLIDEDRVAVRVHGEEAGRPRCALVGLLLQLHSLRLELAL